MNKKRFTAQEFKGAFTKNNYPKAVTNYDKPTTPVVSQGATKKPAQSANK